MAASNQQSKSVEHLVASSQGRRRSGRAWWIVLGLLGALAFAAFLLVARVAVPAWEGYRAARAVADLAGSGIEDENAAALAAEVKRIGLAAQGVERALAPFHPLLRSMGWIPEWGSTVVALPELMSVASNLSSVASDVAPLLDDSLAADDTMARAAALSAALAEEPDRVERMAASAESAHSALSSVDLATLHPALSQRLAMAEPLLELLPDLLRAAPGASGLLGSERPHTFLLLVQNNHEMRPTGGFITAVGRVTLDQGQITELDFGDSYTVFDEETVYPPPPQPMLEFMQIPYLTFRDSNWSPDLPTSAQIARTLYEEDMNAGFDDIITIDLNAVQALVAAIGPLTVPGIDEPITGENIVDIMKELWARPPDSDVSLSENVGQWWPQRKEFIPKLARAVLDKVLVEGVDPLLLATTALEVLDRRGIQLVLADPAVAEVMAGRGWDGALAPVEGNDFLAAVDTNMSYSKVDAVIDRTLAYSVTWPAEPGEGAIAQATVTYNHSGQVADEVCLPTPRYGENKTYDDLISRCYFDYLRLYAPGGSELIDVTGVLSNTISSQRGEKGTQVFAGYFSLKPGESHSVSFRYRLPSEIREDGYDLRIQRQSGTGSLPVTLQIGAVRDAFILEAGRGGWTPPPQN